MFCESEQDQDSLEEKVKDLLQSTRIRLWSINKSLLFWNVQFDILEERLGRDS